MSFRNKSLEWVNPSDNQYKYNVENCLTTMQTGAMQAWKLLFVVSFSSMVFLVCFWYPNLSGNDNILVTRQTRPRDRSKYTWKTQVAFFIAVLIIARLFLDWP